MTLLGDGGAGSAVAPRSPGHPARASRRPRGRRSQLTLLMLACDGLCVLAVVALFGSSAPAVAVFSVSVLVVHAFAGLYRVRLDLSVLDDLPLLLSSTLAATGVAAIVQVATGLGTLQVRDLWIVVGQTLLVAVARSVLYAVRRRQRIAGRVAVRTLVVGCGGLGLQLVEALSSGEHGLRPVGFIDDDPRLPPAQRPLPVLGGIADLRELVLRHRADVVVIAYSNVPEMIVVDVLRGCQGLAVEILVVPRFWQVTPTHRLLQSVNGVPLEQLRRPAFRAPTWALKRVVDVVASSAGLLLATPVLAVCALAVRREVGAGVLFRQERVGLDGQRFELLKLQTMRPDVESDTRWNVEDRVGPVGGWLRRTSLDELPQLWNVLRGDMSLVGPRPERPHFVERFSRDHDGYLWRHRVPAGVTGWAQVNGLRGDTSIEARARFDNHYVENWSLWLDVKILLRTVVQVLTAAGR
ncbi:sugar transferase [Kineococcus rhizosphaerae]|uniref:Exopolysaccharide biosynthesis polyprenyl glycosylphosphotransferase n=1 Tax=Kineococcus rhizosphaerae TaxID=559628 RepID=A0A2T0QYH6_9ACTN|nr:sugar transferase [Kineococcus rhizosphaerae]PRY11421.1 exopolysaccharide biosynthesis polyprenyl glycosylphosphotransferase [Kineococcus rhizosphaerae]